ncbi:KDO2-lipid IV(A) lauroyltransferase [Fibrobacter sp. UWR3]|uniref:lysophospholipid acyltransferase family protein n=1 Tax=Fibrobacter sp. UWR3 TaxID=1896217 RepID=UPI00091D15CE|nr:lysophospholipid acyltransferase family protein [Fibrobacter sp. UWR3]SHM99403.1 KDO2-lipid IV(A) lauroyltransferase [Fibrobacter sp. UWR3]
MPVLRSIMSKVFARTAGFVLRSSGWKRSTVYANLRHVYGTSYSKFYGTLICNLAHHAGELLFRFPTFKKLPREVSAYPCRIEGWDFALAEGSAPVLEKMRGGGIFLTAHFGNYEAIGPWLCRLGIPLVASYIPLRPAWLNRILDKRIRAVDGRPYGVDARTPREFLRLLGDGKLVCLLADQDSRIPSALDGEFMHRPVRNNPLPDFLLRHRPETPVYICWLEDCRGQSKTDVPGISKTIHVLHAIELPRASDTCNEASAPCDKSSKPGGVMPAFNAWLESRIKENPALWYGWTHRRFYSKNPEIYLG